VIILSYLYVCNTSSDNISKVNLAIFKEECKIPLNMDKNGRVGPHDICIYDDKLLTANSFSNSLSIIDTNEEKEVGSYFIGMHCNGVKVFNDNAYVICGELNSLIVFNLKKNKIVEVIPCGSFPHSISINDENALMAISNMHSDSVTLVSCKDKGIYSDIKVSCYPTKAVFTPDGRYLLVCESRMGVCAIGTVSFIDCKTLRLVHRVKVGNSPVDIFTDNDTGYISNFGDGTVSVVDIEGGKEVKRLIIGGMPRGIVKYGKFLYVGDNYNNLLIQVDLQGENKKVISIGSEPTGMTLF
jgi:DNA-binding beta-propeller fold protein YncE